ncbi:hypothetical protein TNCV_1296341 [Trichonephila clavipes]|uniref:Uncharacterized protein n=1 Tax=Trichonephila clavipes TaxID=2585209 RepID=A0A8X6VMR5_TRICX|nr:hypothetical protein TNCV_1296341 [Trichonephila clavipes]
MVQNRAVDDAFLKSLKLFEMLPMQQFPNHQILLGSYAKHGGTLLVHKQKKEQRRTWVIFRRYPTAENLIAFRRAKALARRI